jgi:hypothetical protein
MSANTLSFDLEPKQDSLNVYQGGITVGIIFKERGYWRFAPLNTKLSYSCQSMAAILKKMKELS